LFTSILSCAEILWRSTRMTTLSSRHEPKRNHDNSLTTSTMIYCPWVRSNVICIFLSSLDNLPLPILECSTVVGKHCTSKLTQISARKHKLAKTRRKKNTYLPTHKGSRLPVHSWISNSLQKNEIRTISQQSSEYKNIGSSWSCPWRTALE
jgi:hypothetical protein